MGYGYPKTKQRCNDCGEYRDLDDLTGICDMGKKTYECRNRKQCSRTTEWRKSLDEEKKKLKEPEYALKKYYSLTPSQLLYIEAVSDSSTSYYYYPEKDQAFMWNFFSLKWTVSTVPDHLRKHLQKGK